MKASGVKLVNRRKPSSGKAISWGLCNYSGLTFRIDELQKGQELRPCRRLDCCPAWCLAVVVLITLFSSSDAFGEEYAQFKNFLSSSRPPVKLVRFSRSSRYYLLNGNPISGDVVYEASLQPGTYFIKESGYLWSAQKQDVSMVGKSHDDYWLINERNQVVIANRDPRIAGSNTPPEYLSVSKLAKIQDVLNLGINNLDRNTLSWNGNDFTAKNDRADHVSISGRIVEGDGISPKSLEYTYLGVRRLVNYYYEADPNRPVWCPHLIVVAAVTSSFGNIKPRTNSIETLTLGKADVGEIGYVFTDFYLGNLDMGNLIVYSNGVGNMLVGTNFERIANTPPTFNVSFKNRGLIKAFFFGFLIVIPLVFGWYVARRRSNVLKSGKTT